MKKTVVVGSINRDYTFKLDHLPEMGETILSRETYVSTGGKGANQATALAKLGADVTMIGAVGDDDSGKQVIHSLKDYGIHNEYILVKPGVQTGSAYICVDKYAHNTIVVNPGANAVMKPADVAQLQDKIMGADYCLMQLEIDPEVVECVARICRENNVKVVLNPAPAVENLPEDLLQNVDYLIPNETELEILTGRKVNPETVTEAGNILIGKGVKALIVTMGEHGSYYIDSKRNFFVPAVKTKAVDTTAAGDSYIGALLSGLSRDKDIEEAMKFASAVASITVSRQGAADSIPFLKEIEQDR